MASMLDFFPKSIPKLEAISARLPDMPIPPEDNSGAKTTTEVYSRGVDNAIISPRIAATIINLRSVFHSFRTIVTSAITSISLLCFLSSIAYFFRMLDNVAIMVAIEAAEVPIVSNSCVVILRVMAFCGTTISQPGRILAPSLTLATVPFM